MDDSFFFVAEFVYPNSPKK